MHNALMIKNFEELAKTDARKIVLELIETALKSIQPEEVVQKNIHRRHNVLTICEQGFDLDKFERIFLLGFGKGSAGNSRILENMILDKLTAGYVIDTETAEFEKIEATIGTHPLPSETNFKFTQKALDRLSHLTKRDLVLVVICGGGSAMLVHPHSISLEQKISVGKALLKSGASISEMNTVRKHLSNVKGGGLAQILYPAKVVSLIYSDVPGNDLSVIASGPTFPDSTTIDDAINVLKKYKLGKKLDLKREAFIEKSRDSKYFKNVHNIIVLSNQTALAAMQKKAVGLDLRAKIFSDRFESEAKEAGKKLIAETYPGSILLAGGETTVRVMGNGIGGRNQEVVLGALKNIGEKTIICSFSSDGWDNTKYAGAVGDHKTVEQANNLGIDFLRFLENNNSLDFFTKTGDAIITGRLPSNVADLFIVYKY